MPVKKNKKGLTPQQQKFCDMRRVNRHGLTDGEIYSRCYKTKNMNAAHAGASRLLKQPKVMQYLVEKQAMVEAKTDYDHVKWVDDLLEVKDTCMGRKDISLYEERINDEGKIENVVLLRREFNPAGALRALENIGKHHKWLTEGPPSHQQPNEEKQTVIDNRQQHIYFIAAKMD